jgi:predicted Zn-dependent protease
MPRYDFIGKRVCIYVMMAVAVWVAGDAQAPGNFAPNHNEAEFQVLLKQGFDLHLQARFVEAIPALERARKLEPQDYFVNLLLGIDLLRTGKANEALPRLELAARAKPDEETAEDYIGEAQASLGRYAPAADAYREAMLRGHNSEEALEAWAGFALQRFRQIGESLRASEVGIAMVRRLQKAAALPPSGLLCMEPIPALETAYAAAAGHESADHLAVAYKLSVCYAIQAGKTADRLLTGARDEAAVHRLRGDVLLRVKTDPAAAADEYRKAIALRAGDPALLARLAEAQLAGGDTEGAKQSAQAALGVDPHRPEALRTLAFLAVSDRDYDQALPWLRQLVAESPGDRAAQVELGRALAQTGNSVEALGYLAPALNAGYPDERGALHALEARVLREMGRDQEAAKASAEARRLSDAFQARGEDSGKAHDDQ